jgi:ribosomal protein S27E
VEHGTEEFVQVKCHACGSVHFVNPRTETDAAKLV